MARATTTSALPPPSVKPGSEELFDPFLDRADRAEIIDASREIDHLLTRAVGLDAVFTFPALPEIFSTRIKLDTTCLAGTPGLLLALPPTGPDVSHFRAGVRVNVGYFLDAVFIGMRTRLVRGSADRMRLEWPVELLRYGLAASLAAVPPEVPIIARVLVAGERVCAFRVERLGARALSGRLPPGLSYPSGTAVRSVTLSFGRVMGANEQRYTGVIEELFASRSRERHVVLSLTPCTGTARRALDGISAALVRGGSLPGVGRGAVNEGMP